MPVEEYSKWIISIWMLFCLTIVCVCMCWDKFWQYTVIERSMILFSLQLSFSRWFNYPNGSRTTSTGKLVRISKALDGAHHAAGGSDTCYCNGFIDLTTIVFFSLTFTNWACSYVYSFECSLYVLKLITLLGIFGCWFNIVKETILGYAYNKWPDPSILLIACNEYINIITIDPK